MSVGIIEIGPTYVNRYGIGKCGTDDPRHAGQAMSTMTKKNGNPFSPNKYAGNCRGCGEWVPAGKGIRVGSPPREDGGKWTWNVYC
jgi:hypothetical protein